VNALQPGLLGTEAQFGSHPSQRLEWLMARRGVRGSSLSEAVDIVEHDTYKKEEEKEYAVLFRTNSILMYMYNFI
jgi:hypothetical protein